MNHLLKSGCLISRNCNSYIVCMNYRFDSLLSLLEVIHSLNRQLQIKAIWFRSWLFVYITCAVFITNALTMNYEWFAILVHSNVLSKEFTFFFVSHSSSARSSYFCSILQQFYPLLYIIWRSFVLHTIHSLFDPTSL